MSSDPTGSTKSQHRAALKRPALERASGAQRRLVAANTKTRREPLVSREKRFSAALSEAIQLCGAELIRDGPLVSAVGKHDACALQAEWEARRLLPATIDFKSQRLRWYWLLFAPVPRGHGYRAPLCHGTTNAEGIGQVLEQQTLPRTLMRNVPDYSSSRMPNHMLPLP